jgi:hypothetical protein
VGSSASIIAQRLSVLKALYTSYASDNLTAWAAAVRRVLTTPGTSSPTYTLGSIYDALSAERLRDYSKIADYAKRDAAGLVRSAGEDITKMIEDLDETFATGTSLTSPTPWPAAVDYCCSSDIGAWTVDREFEDTKDVKYEEKRYWAGFETSRTLAGGDPPVGQLHNDIRKTICYLVNRTIANIADAANGPVQTPLLVGHLRFAGDNAVPTNGNANAELDTLGIGYNNYAYPGGNTPYNQSECNGAFSQYGNVAGYHTSLGVEVQNIDNGVTFMENQGIEIDAGNLLEGKIHLDVQVADARGDIALGLYYIRVKAGTPNAFLSMNGTDDSFTVQPPNFVAGQPLADIHADMRGSTITKNNIDQIGAGYEKYVTPIALYRSARGGSTAVPPYSTPLGRYDPVIEFESDINLKTLVGDEAAGDKHYLMFGSVQSDPVPFKDTLAYRFKYEVDVEYAMPPSRLVDMIGSVPAVADGSNVVDKEKVSTVISEFNKSNFVKKLRKYQSYVKRTDRLGSIDRAIQIAATSLFKKDAAVASGVALHFGTNGNALDRDTPWTEKDWKSISNVQYFDPLCGEWWFGAKQDQPLTPDAMKHLWSYFISLAGHYLTMARMDPEYKMAISV